MTILLYITIALMIYIILYSIIDTRKSVVLEGLESSSTERRDRETDATTKIKPNITYQPSNYESVPKTSEVQLYTADLNSTNISQLKNQVDEFRNELDSTKKEIRNILDDTKQEIRKDLYVTMSRKMHELMLQ